MHTIKHAKTSGVADSLNTELIRPSDWNNTHSINWGVATPNVRTFDASMASGGDPNWASVSLLLPFNEANATQTPIDKSSNNIPISFSGNAKITDATDGVAPKYGSGKASITSTSHFSIPANPAINFGTSNFTIEAWINPNAVNGYRAILGGSSGELMFNIQNGVLEAGHWEVGGIALAGAIALTQWSHVAISRSGTTAYLFVNGILTSTGSLPQSLSYANGARIGMSVSGMNAQFDGYIDDLRISKGIARYTSDFTPPLAHPIGMPGITLPDNQNYMSIGPITIDSVDVNVPNNCDWVIM